MPAAIRTSLRNLAPKFALTLGSIFITLAVIEVALRVAGFEPRKLPTDAGLGSWARPNAEMGWINREGRWPSSEPGHVPMSFAVDGHRIDPVKKKSESLPKVLVVGCSLTQGYGVADDQTYSHYINQALPSAEVLNFGTGGYGSFQSRLRVQNYFRSAHADTPLVIYGLFYYHHIRDLAPLQWIASLTTQDGSYMVPPNVRMRSGRIVESAGGPIVLWPLEARSAAVALVHRAVMTLTNHVSVDMVGPVFRHGILEMKRAAEENKARLLIIGLTEVAPPDLAWLQAQRQENGIDFVACHHPDFNKDSGLQVGGVGHPNERMHQWWANCVLKALAERGYAVDQAALAAAYREGAANTN